jgi:hypothetical protein
MPSNSALSVVLFSVLLNRSAKENMLLHLHGSVHSMYIYIYVLLTVTHLSD